MWARRGILLLRYPGIQPYTRLKDVLSEKSAKGKKMKKFFGMLAVLCGLSLGCEPADTTPDTPAPTVDDTTTDPTVDTFEETDETIDETPTDPLE
jgi:hypothetical protein